MHTQEYVHNLHYCPDHPSDLPSRKLINKSNGEVEIQKLFTLGMKTKKYQLLS
jgi:hypothetical protein